MDRGPDFIIQSMVDNKKFLDYATYAKYRGKIKLREV